MSSMSPASLPHLGLILDALPGGSSEFPGPLPHIGNILTGGLAAYTLTAAYGSYAVSGQSAGFATTYSLSAGQGSYTVSGQSAAVGTNRLSPGPLPHLSLLEGLGSSSLRLTADYGTYSVTGQSASFQVGLVMPAGVGYIGVYGQVGLLNKGANSSGESVPLPHLGTLFIPTYSNRTITCDPGTYSINGSDGLLDFEHDADTTTYSITGQDAGMVVGYLLTADQGTYSVSGQSAGSSISGSSLSMAADTGTYSVGGIDVSLVSSYQLPTEHGFYALLGQAAIPIVGVSGVTTLTADYGTYELSISDLSNAILPAPTIGAPGGARSWKHRYMVIINGEKHYGTQEEIEQLIESLAVTQAKKPKPKRAKIAVKPVQEKSDIPAIEAKEDASQLQSQMREMYADLYRKAVEKLAIEEEEDLIGIL